MGNEDRRKPAATKPRPHDLKLGALAAVEQKGLSAAIEERCGEAALEGRDGRTRAENSDLQGGISEMIGTVITPERH